MAAKPKPMVAIDLFAGAGRTDLQLDDRPERTGEWRDGVGRVAGAGAPPPAGLGAFADAVARANPAGGLRWYPGSPLIALDFLRPEDRLVAVELHPEEHALLAERLQTDPRARAVREDGWRALKALTPPTPRRGLLLVDPPFEVRDEEARMLAALADATRRWPVGVQIWWRPVKDLAAAEAFDSAAAERLGGHPALSARLCVKTPQPGAPGLPGSALLIVNPPFGLEASLAEIGPHLAERLAQGPGADWRLARLAETG
ncbi:MAG: 23S rRNA (adenine(2030)-N(6))-methyltransferase RlmJ [Pseudomonadota bacterium]